MNGRGAWIRRLAVGPQTLASRDWNSGVLKQPEAIAKDRYLRTGLNLFDQIPAALQNELEAGVDNGPTE